MPLPIAKMIVPAVVFEWDIRKGRIDEMSGYLARVQWKLAQATPKQQITLREIEKLGLNTFMTWKHCVHPIPREAMAGRTFSQIRKTWQSGEDPWLSFVCRSLRLTSFWCHCQQW
jgi:hypothetical protein